LKQTHKGDPIFARADLALSRRELKVGNGKITGVAHNIGSKDVQDVVVVLIDKQGKTVQSKRLGRVAAPLDLQPRIAQFEFDSVLAQLQGFYVVLDPDDKVPEIFKGNNRLPLGNDLHSADANSP
jgi:hypothetical protein